MTLTITKSSGQSEEFNIQKLIDSLIRSGAPEEIARDIAQKVAAQVTPFSRTKNIFKMARKLLRQYSRVSDMRYSIKRAIYLLGPAGYQFEKYFARVLKAYGYSVEVNVVLNGFCVTHEIDVFASRNDTGFVIECKYHSNGGIPTDVKTALYIYSRFSDIKKAFELTPEGNAVPVRQGWLVTNTRCTGDAIKYAECVGLKITSWKYPEKESLEKMIEKNALYPVTILSSVRKNALDTLFRNDLILAMDIAEMSEQAFIKKSGLDTGMARVLKREADELCLGS